MKNFMTNFKEFFSKVGGYIKEGVFDVAELIVLHKVHEQFQVLGKEFTMDIDESQPGKMKITIEIDKTK